MTAAHFADIRFDLLPVLPVPTVVVSFRGSLKSLQSVGRGIILPIA